MSTRNKWNPLHAFHFLMQDYKLIWRFCNTIYASNFTVNDDVHNRLI